MHPAEEAELLLVVAFLEGHDEAHEADCVQREADDTVICRKRQEVRVREHDMLEICQSAARVVFAMTTNIP